MKCIFKHILPFLFLSAASAWTLTAQSIDVLLKPAIYDYDSLGTSQLVCTYKYYMLQDTSARMGQGGLVLEGDSSAVRTETMLLLCGGEVSKWYSYDKFYSDSLILESMAGKNVNPQDVKIGTALEIYKNYPVGKLTMTDRISIGNYRVTEDMPDFGWKLSDEWKEVAGYRVRKATCSFRGREWTVWFAPDVPVSDGPWKFCGLPGLIFEAYDTRNHYRYELAGIESSVRPVKFPIVNYIDTSLEKYYRTMRRYIEDSSAFMSGVLADIDPSDIYMVRVKKDRPEGSSMTYGFQEIFR